MMLSFYAGVLTGFFLVKPTYEWGRDKVANTWRNFRGPKGGANVDG